MKILRMREMNFNYIIVVKKKLRNKIKEKNK
jgi:hypothetical protein